MTCIVGCEHDGAVYLGGDSNAVAGLDVNTRLDEKVFKNGEFVMGFTTSFRMGQLLRYAFVPPSRTLDEEDDMKYLVTSFVDAVRTTFTDKGWMRTSKNDSQMGGTFLVGYRGKLYFVDDDFQIGRVSDGYMSIGCGESYALGSLHGTRNLVQDPLERLNMALEAATRYSAGVGAPYKFVSTEQEGYITNTDGKQKVTKKRVKSRR